MKRSVLWLAMFFFCGTAAAADYPSGSGSLAGIWRMTGYRGSADYPVRQRIATDDQGKIPPLRPWAAKLLEQRVSDAEKGNIFSNSAAQCLPQGVPYMIFGAGAAPIQIFEEQNQVTLIAEEEDEVWFIYLNQKHPPLDNLAPTYHGDSVAHWDGDTLVVDSVGLTTKTTLDQVGMPHSDALHVVTRIHRVDENTLKFTVLIDDPKTFTTPWTRTVIYKKAPLGERVHEYVCENNINGGENGFQGFNFH